MTVLPALVAAALLSVAPAIAQSTTTTPNNIDCSKFTYGGGKWSPKEDLTVNVGPSRESLRKGTGIDKRQFVLGTTDLFELLQTKCGAKTG